MYELIPVSPRLRKMAANYCNIKVSGSALCKSDYMLVGGETRTQYNEVIEFIQNLFSLL